MEVVIRALIIYPWTVIIFRFMGKGITFQQKPYDFMVMMLIGSSAAALIVNRDVPIINSLVALAALGILHTIISTATLSNKLKYYIGGRPDILIRNGRIVKENLIKNQVNLDQLLAALRNQGYRRIHDIEFAVLEANGQMSVIPKSQYRPINPNDLSLNTIYEGIPTPLILDGQIILKNLEEIGLDIKWLKNKLSDRGITDPDYVLLALIDTDGSLYISEQPDIEPIRSFFIGEGKDKIQGKNPDNNLG
ncbi:YetF domain-containing protein [Natranaerobius thermophilus]|uniref:YetF C-terminal domain-containing protein n=1 Tax=Natranaerobius thermophilus (strain ATCC BAA-1301 / DSM 18059 / JW/NM-WN-LF) TaxID=457570 RepID=B2A7A9_NATTJ|nr:DUF421 domain-containing protein [Natranaerobius thermophilus]ACB84303.1 protein of unknown function DUF421 [Natranaerobius thermophilus JW/NM-WN-LF]